MVSSILNKHNLIVEQDLLKLAGIPVPRGIAASTHSDAYKAAVSLGTNDLVIKAQVLGILVIEFYNFILLQSSYNHYVWNLLLPKISTHFTITFSTSIPNTLN